MTQAFAMWSVVILLLALLPGLLSLLRSRNKSRSLLSIQFIGSGGIALCALFSVAFKLEDALDVALLFALLAASSALVVTIKRAKK